MVRSKSEVGKLHIDKLEKIISTGLNILKSKVDKLHHKLVPVPVDLSKLGDVVKTDLVKKDIYIYIMLISITLKIKHWILIT